jgi:hypothetical protein
VGGGAFFDTVTGGFNQQDQINAQRFTQPTSLGTGGQDTWTYTYGGPADGLSSAVDTHGSSSTTYSYGFDGVGNRTGAGLGSPNSVNEYSAFVYNFRGDETADGTFKYGWDALDEPFVPVIGMRMTLRSMFPNREVVRAGSSEICEAWNELLALDDAHARAQIALMLGLPQTSPASRVIGDGGEVGLLGSEPEAIPWQSEDADARRAAWRSARHDVSLPGGA